MLDWNHHQGGSIAPVPRRGRGVFVLAAVLALASCTVGPNFTPPKTAATSYDTAPQPSLAVPGDREVEQHLALGKKVSAGWWRLFRVSQLDRVLNQAIAGNLNLAEAKANLAQAREAVNVASGGLYPEVTANGGATRQRVSFATLTGISAFPDTVFNVFNFGAGIDYVLDIWGGTRRSIEREAALAQYQSWELDGAYLTLTGNAVEQAIQIASAEAQLQAINDIIADDQRNLDLVRRELRVGTVNDTDVQQAQSQLAADRAQISPLEQQAAVARHALAILVGKSPGDWAPPDFKLADFTLPSEVPVSLPSALVHQRPDVLAAEAQLHAASAEIGVQTAQMFPTISISASMSQAALLPHKLFGDQANNWSFGPSITAPIFRGGALAAQRRAAIDAYHASLASYQETVITSFGQVADLLQALGHDAHLLGNQRQAMEAAKTSLDHLRIAYAAGNVGILPILDAERLYEQALLGYLRAQAQRLSDTVQIYVAMGGGGWWEAPAQKL
jgi:NodT family efflux transporter outer membrane factor (OMF) lipoprotein